MGSRRPRLEAPHGRRVFIQDALASDAILATELNGRPLDAERSFPVRLIVPGWYGMTQVKWLERIVVLDRRYEGRQYGPQLPLGPRGKRGC